MNRTLISKNELARRVTCARSYVYRQFEPGGKLENTLVGSQVDISHPDAAHFCASHGYNQNGATKKGAPKRPDPQPLKRLISKNELARRVNCSRSNVYKVFGPSGKLKNTLEEDKVNLDHPDVVAFCETHGYQEPDGAAIAAEARKSTPPAKPSAPPAAEAIPWSQVQPVVDAFGEPEPEDVTAGELLEMPLREVVARFGTASHLKDYVQVVKSLVQTRGYEEEQARKRKDYIHRVHVEQLVGHIDALQKALLTDAVKNMATRAATQVAAGEEQKAIEAAMRTVISRTIKAAKSELERRLRDV